VAIFLLHFTSSTSISIDHALFFNLFIGFVDFLNFLFHALGFLLQSRSITTRIAATFTVDFWQFQKQIDSLLGKI
jgi:hypothetical protein